MQLPFFAHFNPVATWLDVLEPAFGAEILSSADEYSAISLRGSVGRA